MGLGVDEIRDRAERLKAAVALERYEAKSGRKSRPAFADVYAAHSLLAGPGVLPVIQRALAESTGEAQRRLRSLFAWVAEQRVEAALAPLEDQYRAWEVGTTVLHGDEEIRLRQVVAAEENEADRAARLALDRERNARLEEAIPLQVDTLHREREAVAGLGLGDFMEARERLSGLNIRGLAREAVRILAATDDLYGEHSAYQLRKRVGVAAGTAERADLRWLARMAWHDESFGLDRVLQAMRRDLREMGLPLEANGRLKLDLEARPLKTHRSFCAAIRVPDRAIVVIAPSGGWPDAVAFLHELGHALHFAYTARTLPFEYRSLGDTSVTETYAILFELLALERPWLERGLGLTGSELEEYLLLSSFLELYKLRRHAALLLYQLELADAELPGEMGDRYVELLTGATRFRHDPRTYLEDVDRGFWVARQLRAWMLRAILGRQLRDRYDVDWFRNPGAGPYLGELLSAGQRDDAGQLAMQLGAERLNADLLLADVKTWLR